MLRFSRSLVSVRQNIANCQRLWSSDSGPKLPTLFSSDGRVVELDQKMDYFTLFGFERSFNLEIADVAKIYKNLQKQLHPDKVSNQHSKEIYFINIAFSLSKALQKIVKDQRPGPQLLMTDIRYYKNL